MSNPVWPAYLTPSTMEWRLCKTGSQTRSQITGSFQAIDFMGEYWQIIIGLHGEGRNKRRSAKLEALLMWLAGGFNQIDVYNWVRPIPAGTLRGTPTIKNATVSRDSSLVLNVAAGAVIEAGDFLGAGGQVFMAKERCVAVGTTLTVPLINRVRGVIAEDSPVTWDHPLLSVVAPEMTAGLVYTPGITQPTEVTLIEP